MKMNEIKMVAITTEDDLELIGEYIKKQNFKKKETNTEIIDIFLVMIAHNIEPTKALKNISCIVNALKIEFEYKPECNECIECDRCGLDE